MTVLMKRVGVPSGYGEDVPKCWRARTWCRLGVCKKRQDRPISACYHATMTLYHEARKSRWSLAMWTVGGWISCHCVLIATHVVLIFLYSLFVAPGLPEAHYAQFAQESGPWFSILAGGPVFYALAKVLQKKIGSRAPSVGIWVWTLYSLTDLSILLAFVGVPSPLLAGQWVTSQTIKLAALKIARPSTNTVSNPPGPTAEPGRPT